jgi:hypothetical protein
MVDTPFTARNAAKFVVKAVVAAKTKQIAEDTIVEHTQFEDDDTIVEISSSLIGWYVSSKLQPLTDKMVDKTADFVAAKRAERAAKKETSEEK